MINPEDDKKFDDASALEYIADNKFKVYRMLNEKFRRIDHEWVMRELLETPIALANIIKYNYAMSESERLRHVVSMVCKPGSITNMLGAKGGGKTATQIWFNERVHEWYPDKRLLWFGFNDELEKRYPYIKPTWDLVNIENSFVTGDEVILYAFSRDAMKKGQKSNIKKIPTIRHRNGAGMFAGQFARGSDVDLFLLGDYLWFKPYYLTEFDDRLRLPKWLKHVLPHKVNENLLYDMNYQVYYTFTNPLPKYWSDAMSRPFSILRTRQEAIAFARKLETMGMDDDDITMVLDLRGIEFDDIADAV